VLAVNTAAPSSLTRSRTRHHKTVQAQRSLGTALYISEHSTRMKHAEN